MKDSEIIYLSKSIFGLFFTLGSICLVGAFITKQSSFAVGGYFILILGLMINLVAVLWLLIYGLVYRAKFDACLKAIGILAINIPIAALYTIIGLNIH
ncbi:hypothetical protein [Chryseobacterium lactis]|uniref:hypothetical protein n=1 Tax=Chryseobacterium lactis TaxID=1241981 RepID=UPI0016260432|nr:hypothetical protein [Chryseobacterium lactis]